MTPPSKFILRIWRTSGLHKMSLFVFSFELLSDFLMPITDMKSWASLWNQSQATSDHDLAVTKGGVQKPISSCYFQLCKLTVLPSPFAHSTPPLYSIFFSSFFFWTGRQRKMKCVSGMGASTLSLVSQAWGLVTALAKWLIASPCPPRQPRRGSQVTLSTNFSDNVSTCSEHKARETGIK